MSDTRKPQHPRRDEGVTLIEMLISVMVLGIIATVISASLVVTLRTSTSTEGRLNVARAEQNVATWLPADLSSAVDATDLPDQSPCGMPDCPGVGALGGSNALMVEFPNPAGTDIIKVAYIYREAANGTFELVRVKCEGGVCSDNTVLRDLEGPENFVPGVTPVPDDVISVTVPLVAGATEVTAANLDTGSTARRIVVTINGGGESEGAGGGVNRVSITAGGTSLGDLEPAKVTGPSFTQARSRCGGPITIIVDDSGSIANSGGTTDTEEAVVGFVEALAGTPTSVKLVKFSKVASTIGTTGWDHRFDMSDATAVDSLIGVGGSGGLIRDGLDQSGGTNWEDAIYRTFYAPNGDRLDDDGSPATELPNLVVFFTDGKPTFNRAEPHYEYDDGVRVRGNSSSEILRGVDDLGNKPALPVNDPARWEDHLPWAQGQQFDQEGYNRAAALLDPFRNTDEVRLIGVGVGGISTESVQSFNTSSLLQFNNIEYKYLPYKNSSGIRVDRLVYQRSWHDADDWFVMPNSYTSWVPAEKALGNLIAGGSLQASSDKPYVKSTYDNGTGEWSSTETADMFITSDFDKLPSALATIALGQCGGTLTLQTDLGGSPAPADFSYETGGETVTTSLVNRAAAFDLTIPGGAAVTSVVTPQSFDETGYDAVGWSCKSKGANVPQGSAWSYVDPGDAAQGIEVTVAANEAFACTLEVTTS